MPPETPPPPTARPRAPERANRVGAAVLALACLAVLGIAAWLRPSPDGHGTHTQLGLAQCQWVMMFNEPCPTCGMTTSFAYAAHMNFLAGARTQPFGFVLALTTATIFWGAAHVALTGSTLGNQALRLVNGRTLLAVFAMLLAAWVYKLATWPA